MRVISARNPHMALPQALQELYLHGEREESRNGPVMRMPDPVATVLSHPQERLTFHPWRDDNPFFLHVESLWMLAGRDDLAQLTPYVKRMANYSDDGGKTQPGAYGKRWRNHRPALHDYRSEWGDQLNWAVRRLTANPGDRRVVIQMWDPGTDIKAADNGGADVPCNLTILPWLYGGKLHLTVFNRSNDIVWGLYSANAVQFSTLLEYLATRLGVGMGSLTTLSNNFHAYLATLPEEQAFSPGPCPYSDREPALHIEPLGSLWELTDDTKAERFFQEDLAMVFEYKPEEAQLKARSRYIRRVTMPLMIAHKHYRENSGADRYLGALDALNQMVVCDWQVAATNWIERRYHNWLAKRGDAGE